MLIAEINERKNLSLALSANARTAFSEDDTALALPVAIEARYVFEPPEAEVLRILGSAAFAPGPRFRFADSSKSTLTVESNSSGTVGAYAGTEGVIRLVSTSTGELLSFIEAGSPVTGLSISNDDQPDCRQPGGPVGRRLGLEQRRRSLPTSGS